MENKRFKLTFDIFGFLLFVLLMIPTVVWSVVPALKDILRTESSTPLIDTAAAAVQVLAIIAICLPFGKSIKKFKFGSVSSVITIIFAVLYYIAWMCYYLTIIHPIVLVSLAVLPCIALLAHSIGKRNVPAMILIVIFAAIHLSSTVINFVM